MRWFVWQVFRKIQQELGDIQIKRCFKFQWRSILSGENGLKRFNLELGVKYGKWQKIVEGKDFKRIKLLVWFGKERLCFLEGVLYMIFLVYEYWSNRVKIRFF